MKKYWLLPLVLAAIIALSVLSINYLGDTTRRIDHILPQLEDSIAAENWSEAQLQYTAAKKIWDQANKILPTFINHDDMRDVQVAFVDLETAIKQQDKIEATRELAALHFYIDHVLENEHLNLQNLL